MAFQKSTLLLLSSLFFAQAPSAVVAVPINGFTTKYYDIQGHRGGRGIAVESTLPSFAWGLIQGVTTLEMDNGITKDGKVVVWHDEEIAATKCKDTGPAFPNDPLFPYVGKYIVNLTLAQVKTLDCGSQRILGFPLQLAYPKTPISTMDEVFDFVRCVDTDRKILFNIESKIDPPLPNLTAPVDVFVKNQYAAFKKSGYLHSITYQSFDWRSIIAMKKLDPSVTTSALIDGTTTVGENNATSDWLAGIRLDSFPGTQGEQIAAAAHSINADVISPAALAPGSATTPLDPTKFLPFTTADMVKKAHAFGQTVRPWTVNDLGVADYLLDIGVDGIITDYPDVLRRLIEQRKLKPAPAFSKEKVWKCLVRHS